ncbi:MAG: hypothetical protein AB7G11_17755 [Phycisphaerales bacterium]
MPRRILCVLASLPVLAAPALALAQDEHAGGHAPVGAIPSVEQGAVTAVTGLVVFALVFAVLALKVWPVITKALDERADKIRSEIEAAEMAQQQAKQALEQYERNLAEARAKAQKMLDDAVAQQQAIATEQKAKLEADLAKIREKNMKDLESAKRAALNEIYAEAANAATMMATKILKREVTPRDQQRLVEESLAELSGVSRN